MARMPLGKAALIPYGAYSAATQYYRGNLVTYQYATYVAKQEVKGVLPTNVTYWMQVTWRGETGASGDGSGDMLKSEYGGSGVGVVRDADRLGGVDAAGYLQKAGNASNATVDYVEPASMMEPVSGGKLAEIVGRIVKWIRATAAALTASRTLYVNAAAAAGGDGTAAKPYRTIKAAIDALPRSTNGAYTVTINIAAGTYDEIVMIQNFNYRIVLNGAALGSVILSGLYISDCSVIQRVHNVTIQHNPAMSYAAVSGRSCLLYQSNSKILLTSGINIVGDTGCTGILVGDSSAIYGTLSASQWNISGCGVGIEFIGASMGYIGTLPAVEAPNLVGIRAGNMAIAGYYAMDAGFATTLMATSAAGRIYAGAQASVPNY